MKHNQTEGRNRQRVKYKRVDSRMQMREVHRTKEHQSEISHFIETLASHRPTCCANEINGELIKFA